MEKSKFTSSVWMHIILLLVLPPVGLFLFWRSRRSLWIKTWASIIALIVLGVMVSGVWGVIVDARVPSSGYDVSIDSLGRYNTPRILEYEKEIFNEVMQFKREHSGEPGYAMEDYRNEPDAFAFMMVAQNNNLSYDDVRAIYWKVSVLLSSKLK